MNYVALFFIILTGDLVAHYICKWVDRKTSK